LSGVYAGQGICGGAGRSGHLRAGLERYGIGGDDFLSRGKEWLSAFLDDIPSAAITMTLTEKGFRNADKAESAGSAVAAASCWTEP
jgi:hypothetical protein